jgi:hypothetical protein
MPSSVTSQPALGAVSIAAVDESLRRSRQGQRGRKDKQELPRAKEENQQPKDYFYFQFSRHHSHESCPSHSEMSLWHGEIT